MDKMSPCVEYCYARYGKQYTPACDDMCDYAAAVKENQKTDYDRMIDLLDKQGIIYSTCGSEVDGQPGSVIVLEDAPKIFFTFYEDGRAYG